MSIRCEKANGEFLWRASSFDYNSLYGIGGWVRFKSDPGIGGQSIVSMSDEQGINGLEDRESLYLNAATDRFQLDSTNAGVDIGPPGMTGGSLPNPVQDVWYYSALCRDSVTHLLSYVGSSPDDLEQQGDNTHSSVTGRNAAGFLSLATLLSHGAFSPADIELAGWKAWQGVAPSLAQWKDEMLTRAAVHNTAEVWAIYEMLNAADLSDASGNSRPLTAGGTLSDGEGDPPLLDAVAAPAAQFYTRLGRR